jgi:formylglycine-generating enzyme required for sulfatase activity
MLFGVGDSEHAPRAAGLLRPRSLRVAVRSLWVLAALCSGGPWGCTAIMDTRGFAEGNDVDGGAPATPGESGTPLGCIDGEGPRQVRVAGFGPSVCIDVTEVTQGHYARFLAALDRGARVSGLPAACAGDSSREPSLGWAGGSPLAGTESLPVVHIDWCDAQAFCLWAGKRLCGAPLGGPVGAAGGSEPTASTWFAACAGVSGTRFPYGGLYEPFRCNGPDALPQQSVAVGEFAECISREGGPVDMSGNVAEWEDGCRAEEGLDDGCPVRGGSFRRRNLLDLAGGSVTCAAREERRRGASTDDVGFRCCSP